MSLTGKFIFILVVILAFFVDSSYNGSVTEFRLLMLCCCAAFAIFLWRSWRRVILIVNYIRDVRKVQAYESHGESLVFTDCCFTWFPPGLLGKHVIFQANSGTQKMSLFVLSAVQQFKVDTGEHKSTIILCHTKELADKIFIEFEKLKTESTPLKVKVLCDQCDVLENECPHIVVGTPARILSVLIDGDLSVKNVRLFILDECDKMLQSHEMRSIVHDILNMTPHNKQVMMFTENLTKEIRWVCKNFMQDPMEVYVEDGAMLTLHGLVHNYIKLTETEKKQKLNDLLLALNFNQAVIFVKSMSRAAELNKLLMEYNFPSICIDSGMDQEERLKLHEGFKEGQNRILVTDLVGIRIDIERVNIVINYDMPDSADTYLHRVGRAGTFGTKGMVITIVSSASDQDVLNNVEERFQVDIRRILKTSILPHTGHERMRVGQL